MKGKKIYGSFASYRTEIEDTCDIDELARILSENWGNIPKHIGDIRAMEIHSLAKAFMQVVKQNKALKIKRTGK